MDFFRYDFDYAWPWAYGHLIAALTFAGLAWAAYRLHWRLLTVVAGALMLWGLCGAAIIHGALRFSRPAELPTEHFLSAGSGRVLDAGAGSGRSTLMVLLARPGATVVALDRFSGYYGIVDNTPDRLRANARAAGVEGRLEVQIGDMREMPFEDASFDGVVSVAAIDHLDKEGVERTLAEVRRVLRPDGQFLLMVVHPDVWTKVALPFLHGHGYFGARAFPDRWRSQLEAAGLSVIEEGTQPASMYFLARKTARLKPDTTYDRSRQREDVHGASLGHFRILTGEEAIQSVVHTAWVAPPSAVNRKVLLPVD
jgi:SAM-dependent methyltransferase